MVVLETLWGMPRAVSANSGNKKDIEVPSRVDGKRMYLARVSDFVSWDEACRVSRHDASLSVFTYFSFLEQVWFLLYWSAICRITADLAGS